MVYIIPYSRTKFQTKDLYLQNYRRHWRSDGHAVSYTWHAGD